MSSSDLDENEILERIRQRLIELGFDGQKTIPREILEEVSATLTVDEMIAIVPEQMLRRFVVAARRMPDIEVVAQCAVFLDRIQTLSGTARTGSELHARILRNEIIRRIGEADSPRADIVMLVNRSEAVKEYLVESSMPREEFTTDVVRTLVSDETQKKTREKFLAFPESTLRALHNLLTTQAVTGSFVNRTVAQAQLQLLLAVMEERGIKPPTQS